MTSTNDIMVSVVVASYFPKWEKMRFTLDSILCQKNVKLQIIVSDDGSDDNLFDQISDYMAKNNFDNFKLVGDGINHGTLINIFNGTKAAKGDYVKFISPGDALRGDEALSNWLGGLLLSGHVWSFCDAVYFNPDDSGKILPVSANANPQLIDCYKNGDELLCRWNYLALDDLVLGACTLGKKDVLEDYLSKCAGKVKYAEDNIYRLMMYDGLTPFYYEENAVYYEYGTGVSTSANEKWTKLLLADANAANSIMFADEPLDEFQAKVLALYEKRKKDSVLKWLNLTAKGRLKIMLKRNLFPRKTSMES